MIVTIRYPKPLNDFRPPLDETNPILWIFHFTNYPDLYNLWILLSKKAQKKWMDPLGIHPLKLTQNPTARR